MFSQCAVPQWSMLAVKMNRPLRVAWKRNKLPARKCTFIYCQARQKCVQGYNGFSYKKWWIFHIAGEKNMVPKLSMPWKDKSWSAEYKDLKSMDFHKVLFLPFPGVGVAITKTGDFWLSDISSPFATWIRDLCWTCGFMLLFCQLQALSEVSPHQVFIPKCCCLICRALIELFLLLHSVLN